MSITTHPEDRLRYKPLGPGSKDTLTMPPRTTTIDGLASPLFNLTFPSLMSWTWDLVLSSYMSGRHRASRHQVLATTSERVSSSSVPSTPAPSLNSSRSFVPGHWHRSQTPRSVLPGPPPTPRAFSSWCFPDVEFHLRHRILPRESAITEGPHEAQ